MDNQENLVQLLESNGQLIKPDILQELLSFSEGLYFNRNFQFFQQRFFNSREKE